MDERFQPADASAENAPGAGPDRGPGDVPPGEAVTTASPAPPPEKPQRKGPRALIVIVMVALIALGVAGWVYVETVGTQRAAVERLDEATRLVESADTVVLDFDEIVRAEIDAATSQRAQEVGEQVPDAVAELERAVELIGEAREDLPSADVAYALALRDSAAARLEMLEFADPILEVNRKASAALGPSAQGWELIVESEELSMEAATEYSKLTREGVERSTELAGEAIAKVSSARELFSEAATAFPEVDFAAYEEYCEKKLAALEISKQADAAWLAGNIAEANTLGTRYNEAEQELAGLAADLPSSPAILIAAAFEEFATEPTAAYFEARARATAADARLRETTGQPTPEPEADGEPDGA